MEAVRGKPVTACPPMVMEPLSGATRPATIFISVVLPDAEAPTIHTNSPSSTARLMFASTRRDPYSFETSRKSMNAILSCPEPRLSHPHQPVESESDHADRQNAQKNVGVNQAVILLPQETPDTRSAGKHLRRYDD